METIKAVIFIACVIGVAGVMFDFAIPEGSTGKQLGFLLGIVMLLALISPFTDNGFEFSEKSFSVDFSQKNQERNLEDKSREIILENTSRRIEEYFLDKLNKYGVKAEKIQAKLYVNDKDEIEITEIGVKASCNDDSEKEKIKSLITQDLENCKVVFIGEDNNDKNEDY